MRIGEDSRVLVTGGCGFIGSHLIRRLLRAGCHVLNIDKLTYAGNPRNLSDVDELPRYAFSCTDIVDFDSIQNLMNQFQPDVIFHLAAESHVDRSISGPMEFIHSNITGTAVMLQAARGIWLNSNRERLFVHVSTDEVYGALGDTGSFDENSSYSPRSPYSASKAAGDHLVRSWGHTYGLPVIVTHSSNNYGSFQHPEKLIPLCILNALHGKTIPVYGDGRQIRDWIHVEDHCDALLLIAQHGESGQSYHIGAHEEHRNLDVIMRILDELRRQMPNDANIFQKSLITHVADRPGHDFRYSLDASRLRTEFGWKPVWSFENGIRETVRWYIENETWWRGNP